MKSRLFFLSVLILTGAMSPVFSQSVGVGTNSPNANAALDVVAPNGDQGILLPRLSGAQRLNMSLGNAERGLIVYDTTDNAFYYWDGSQWLRGLGNGGGGDFQNLAFEQATALLSIENGNSVDLSSLIDDADADPANEAITDFRITATDIEIEENGVVVGSIPLSGLPTGGGGTDNQQITQFTLAGALSNEVQLTLEDDASGQKVIDLHSMQFAAASDLTNTLGQATIKDGAVGNSKISDVDPSKLNQEGAVNGDVLKWNGSSWVPDTDQTGVTPAVTEYLAIDPSAFTMLFSNNGATDENHMLIFANNNAFVTVRDASDESEIIAPVNIPDGVTIDEVTVYYMDDAPMNVRVELFRKPFTGPNEPMASWQSSSNTNAIQSANMGPITNPVVDNSQYSYRLVVDLPATSGEVDNPNQAEHRLYGIRIQYTK